MHASTFGAVGNVGHAPRRDVMGPDGKAARSQRQRLAAAARTVIKCPGAIRNDIHHGLTGRILHFDPAIGIGLRLAHAARV